MLQTFREHNCIEEKVTIHERSEWLAPDDQEIENQENPSGKQETETRKEKKEEKSEKRKRKKTENRGRGGARHIGL